MGVKLNPFVEKAITEAATRTAELFFEEHGEPLDSAKTDWDAVAWKEDAEGIGLTREETEHGWPHYVAVLERETKRLYDAAQATI